MTPEIICVSRTTVTYRVGADVLQAPVCEAKGIKQNYFEHNGKPRPIPDELYFRTKKSNQ